MNRRFRVRKECLGQEKNFFSWERKVKMKSGFAVNIYIEIAAWWIEDLSRSVEHYISTDMNLSRCCRESIYGKIILMDRDSIENLSAKQKLSRWIENLSRSYRDKFQIARWIKYAIRSVEKRSPRGSIDRKLSRIYREVIELDKKQFFKERKNT